MILLVEDNDITRGATADLLRIRGFTVREAVNARQAIPMLAERLPAVLVLDLMLPDMNGAALLERLHKMPGWQRVRVIITTAMPEPLPALPSDMACEVLHKPFEVGEVVERIVKVAPEEAGRLSASGPSGAGKDRPGGGP